jgi:GNAT superfamily N-acetyltransferase
VATGHVRAPGGSAEVGIRAKTVSVREAVRVAAEVFIRSVDAPSERDLVQLAGLFDLYRAHYGQPIRDGQSASWLSLNVRGGCLTAFIAEMQGEMVGFALTMDVPASLRLGHYWQIRDLFVAPSRRRLGVARSLLDAVQASAASAGALRMAVQTEDDNAIALQLYESGGFVRVEGYCGLTLSLEPVERA